jgi:hypothetical protein
MIDYKSHSIITDPRSMGELYKSLPDTVPEIVDVIHNLFIHIFWAERYGVTLDDSKRSQVQLRYVESMLKKIMEIDPSPLNTARPLDKRLVANCRDFSVFLCSILRSKGIPARARCGFGRYFNPGWFEDHWMCEYYDGERDRWISVDAQLDSLQREVLGIDFDPLDMPKGRFVTGSEAWKMCRSGLENPNNFGIFDMSGLWFVRGDFIRDVASINKMELLPWDGWGLADKDEKELTEQDYVLLDKVAELVISGSPEIYNIYENAPEL